MKHVRHVYSIVLSNYKSNMSIKSQDIAILTKFIFLPEIFSSFQNQCEDFVKSINNKVLANLTLWVI